jgi:hypothetical protein
MTYKGIVNSDDVSGSNHSDFPLYVDLTAIDTLTQSEADSIRVYSDSSLTTELPREIVSTEEMHFKSSSLNGGDEYYVDYDGVRSDYAIGATYGAENVWDSNYKAVWHKGTWEDSTSNSNDLSVSYGSPDTVDGKIGKAKDYKSGKNTAESPTGMISDWTQLTLSGWFYSRDDDGWKKVIDHGRDSNNRDIVRVGIKGPTDDWAIVFEDSDNNSHYVYGSLVSINTWIHLVGIYDGSNDVEMYENGSFKASGDGGGTKIKEHSSNFFRLARSVHNYEDWNGIIEELRLFKGKLSSDWISTEYNNQNDPDSFWTWEEAVVEVTFKPKILNVI